MQVARRHLTWHRRPWLTPPPPHAISPIINTSLAFSMAMAMAVGVGGTLAAVFGLAAHLKCFFHLPAKIITTQIGLPNCYLLKINAAGHRLT